MDWPGTPVTPTQPKPQQWPGTPVQAAQPAAPAEPDDPFARGALAIGSGETAEHLIGGLRTAKRAFGVEPHPDEGFFSPRGIARDFTRPLKFLSGIFEAGTAPVTGPVEHAEKGVESATGGFIRPQDIDKVLTAVPMAPKGAATMGTIAKIFRRVGRAGRELKDFTRTVSDDLFRLRQSETADRAEIAQHVSSASPEFRTATVQERVYHNIESQSPHAPVDQPDVNRVLKPMQDEQAQIYNELRNKDYPNKDISDPAYVYRRAEGHHPELEGRDDPIIGGRQRQLKRTTHALQSRKMLGAKESGGGRIVVSEDPAGGGYLVHTPGRKQPTRAKLVQPDVIEHQGKHYTIGQATTKEIEAATAAEKSPVRYHKNALANTAAALVRMRAVKRNVNYLDGLQQTKQWGKYATTDAKVAKQKGWIESKLPQLKGHYMEPKLAHAFDDFYEPGAGSSKLLDALRKVNQFATASLFWQPTPHIENVMTHWIVGRGWDWIKPSGIRSLYHDGSRAIRAVTTQNKDYQRLLREGSGMLYGSVRNADFYRQVAKIAGMDIQRNPARWDPIARTLGLGPSDLIRAIYEGSSRVLWWANDVFMMQRVLELERKGLSTRKAIAEAEKHIPNYRVPAEVFNSRAVSQALQDPAFLIFGRYHYGQLNSYANMIKDAIKGHGQERFDAIGNLMALGVLTYAVYPLIGDTIARVVTGDPDAKKLRRGPSTIPNALDELYDGQKNVWQVIGDVVTPALMPRVAGTLLGGGHDPFTGKTITEPGSEGSAQAAQFGDWMMGQLFQPYQLATQRGEEEGGRTAAQKIRDATLGLQNVSPATERGRDKAQKQQRRAASKRESHPRGWLETLFGDYQDQGE